MNLTPKNRAILAWSWTALLGIVVGVTVAQGPPAGTSTSELIQGTSFLLSAVVTTAMGALLFVKVPENRMYWLFLGTGLGMVLTFLVSVPDTAPADPSFWTYVAIVFQNALATLLLFYLLGLMFHLFPAGQFINKRWRWAGWFGYIAFPLLLIVSIFEQDAGPAFVEPPWFIDNPIGFIPVDLVTAISGIVWPALYVVLIGAPVALIVRYRRATPTVRAQIKWLIGPCLLLIAGFFMTVSGLSDLLSGLLFVAPYLVTPIAMTIAITRYRLFDIDRLISRTLAYTFVVGVLVVLFASVAVWLPTLLFGDSDPIFVAGATLAVAALFSPLRQRIQRIVDRRFNRSAYEARLLAEEFGTTVRRSLSVEELGDVWVATVEDALQPDAVGVWVKGMPSQTTRR